ncbi:NUMOD4 motif-containing HNH endonuclease [Staphylococcus haemolyticus]|uniref:NUMOD4 motif-containing HNH endonuclease n=1 Tax=Staphylococcus haemolyticus TaxID=1283 RepID=UPI002883C2C9|nr:NUMOD4 motif-containing HNH endonuclease [Staphylococcus haemolyticus]MDT0722590.1 NUMOD4 motif-containing HNH endonuclease [Staphylococcus haemolyticus]
MTEIWKDVVGYEGIYEVSNKGRVRTHKDKISWSKRYKKWRYWKQRYLKDKTPNGRDVRVTLWKDGKPNYYLVHRLVAYAFIPKIEGKNCINHIDGNPKNNNVENLEWCNHLENNRHAFETGLMTANMKVKLINHLGIEYEFISMSRASKFLGRNHGYVSRQLKNNYSKLTDADGNKYKVEKLV